MARDKKKSDPTGDFLITLFAVILTVLLMGSYYLIKFLICGISSLIKRVQKNEEEE